MSSSFDQNPFQRLTAGSAMGRSFSLLAQRFDVYIGITLVMWLPILAMIASLVYAIGSSMVSASQTMGTTDSSGYQSYDSQSAAYDQLTDSLLAGFKNFLGQLLAEYVLLIVASILGKAAMCYAVAVQYMGNQPSFGGSLKQGCARWCDLFCTSITLGLCLLGVHIVFGLIVLGIAMISDKLSFLILILQICYMVVLVWLFVSLIILTPVIIVERKTMLKAVERCWNLANGQRCFLFCTIFALTIVYYLIQLIVAQILFAVHPDGSGVVMTSPILYAVVTTLPALIYVPMVSMYVYFCIIASITANHYPVPHHFDSIPLMCTASRLWSISISVSSKKE